MSDETVTFQQHSRALALAIIINARGAGSKNEETKGNALESLITLLRVTTPPEPAAHVE
jgi:hypothetical protein